MPRCPPGLDIGPTGTTLAMFPNRMLDPTLLGDMVALTLRTVKQPAGRLGFGLSNPARDEPHRCRSASMGHTGDSGEFVGPRRSPSAASGQGGPKSPCPMSIGLSRSRVA